MSASAFCPISLGADKFPAIQFTSRHSHQTGPAASVWRPAWFVARQHPPRLNIQIEPERILLCPSTGFIAGCDAKPAGNVERIERPGLGDGVGDQAGM
ncbi:hypothetical protein [Halotalea alkalilenta]|uniref:hypothetical protein n=1 Tax=Halotalea alkalilenta TaxID=376489 RepID=UPI001237792A|nr:hypothetical protein [Halotalea alkalilenta]